TGPLVPGTPFHMDASARNGADRGGKLSLRMLPRPRDGMLRFENIDLQIGVEQGAQAHLAGDAAWGGGDALAANLRGGFTLAAHGSTVAVASTPAPAASAAAPEPARSYTLALRIQPAQGAMPMVAALKLDGEGQHVDVTVQPAALPGWWSQVLGSAPETALAAPPVAGNAQLDALDVGPLHMRGVRIEAGPHVVPASAATAGGPAESASSGD
ncbi:MAG TPA: hypothetical protein VF022_11215, partial [Rhodanobacteraceae bacterium]